MLVSDTFGMLLKYCSRVIRLALVGATDLTGEPADPLDLRVILHGLQMLQPYASQIRSFRACVIEPDVLCCIIAFFTSLDSTPRLEWLGLNGPHMRPLTHHSSFNCNNSSSWTNLYDFGLNWSRIPQLILLTHFNAWKVNILGDCAHISGMRSLRLTGRQQYSRGSK